MVSPETEALAKHGEEIYEQRLRESLEETHHGSFVAIEPESGDYFLGRSLSEAIGAARQTYPSRICYARRIGYPVAFEIGFYPC